MYPVLTTKIYLTFNAIFHLKNKRDITKNSWMQHELNGKRSLKAEGCRTESSIFKPSVWWARGSLGVEKIERTPWEWSQVQLWGRSLVPAGKGSHKVKYCLLQGEPASQRVMNTLKIRLRRSTSSSLRWKLRITCWLIWKMLCKQNWILEELMNWYYIKME